MTYRVEPVQSYETEQGCTVVSQVQENAHGLVIEHVALMCLRAGDGAAGAIPDGAAAVRCPSPARSMSRVMLALMLVTGMAWAETATLTWVAPTQNEDGSPLTDLDGYRIRYGCAQSGSYTETVVLDDETATQHVVEGLPSPGTCYFVISAVNEAGVESRYSNEASKTFAPRPNPPSMLTVQGELTVYTIVQSVDRVALVAVGNAQPGAPCDSEQSVNGMHVVPLHYVTIVGNVAPQVVFGRCS